MYEVHVNVILLAVQMSIIIPLTLAREKVEGIFRQRPFNIT
jgi:hypothetical protein